MDRPLRQGLTLAGIACALAGICAACEGPPWPAQSPTASDTVAPDAGAPVAEAGATAAKPFHAMTLAQCARDQEACARAHAVPTSGPAYLVAFGSGNGSTRTRDQAMADLYRELRDRSASGAHLAAHPHHLDEPEGGAPSFVDDSDTKRGTPPVEGDPLVGAAMELMGVVDREGEITVDVAPSNGTCKVGLGLADGADAGFGGEHCFVREEINQRPGMTRHR